jgi:hypothetical protein
MNEKKPANDTSPVLMPFAGSVFFIQLQSYFVS